MGHQFLGLLHIVGNPLYGNRPADRVEHYPGCPGIEITGLAYAAGVDEIAAIFFQFDRPLLDNFQSTAGIFRCDKRAVGVPDEADLFVEVIEAPLGIHPPHNIVPLRRLVRGGVNEKTVLLAVHVREGGEKIAVPIGEDTAGPLHGGTGVLVEIDSGGEVDRRRVVVPHEDHRRLAEEKLDALSRLGAVTDHVTEADNTVGTAATHLGEHTLEGFKIAVNV